MRYRIPAILLVIGVAFAPRASEAVPDLRIRLTDMATGTILATLSGPDVPPVNESIPLAGTYGKFVITNCTTAIGCSGLPARVFPQSSASLDKLSLADAIIRYSPPAGTAGSGRLRIQFQSSHFGSRSAGAYTLGVNAAGLASGRTASRFVLSDKGFRTMLPDFAVFEQGVEVTVPPFNPGSTSFLRQATGLGPTCGTEFCSFTPMLGGDALFTFLSPGDLVKITQASLDVFISMSEGGAGAAEVDAELARLAALPIGPPPAGVAGPASLLLVVAGLGGCALMGRRATT